MTVITYTPMTKAEVVRLAKEKALAERIVGHHAAMNVFGRTAEQLVDMAAAFQIAQDKAALADRAYQAAFAQWHAEGFKE